MGQCRTSLLNCAIHPLNDWALGGIKMKYIYIYIYIFFFFFFLTKKDLTALPPRAPGP